jgi:DNA-directed RNA polymerase subunit E'/Rpb7
MTDDIYSTILINKPIILESKNIKKNINNKLLSIFKSKYEGKCLNEGYLKEDSSKLLTRSVGNVVKNSFSGAFRFECTFEAEVCNPLPKQIIKCKINKNNELGLMCIYEPLQIIIPKALHNNKALFNDLSVGDEIEVVVIAKKFNLFDKTIYVTGKLSNDSENKKVEKKKVEDIVEEEDVQDSDDEEQEFSNINISTNNEGDDGDDEDDGDEEDEVNDEVEENTSDIDIPTDDEVSEAEEMTEEENEEDNIKEIRLDDEETDDEEFNFIE